MASPPQTPALRALTRGKPGLVPTPGDNQLPPIRLQQRNERGGVVVYEEEIKDAFSLLAGEGREALSREDLSQFLDNFFPGMLSHKEVKSMIGPSGMSLDKLKKLLQSNDLQDFDPIAEAFKVLDPEGKGEMDLEVLKGLLTKMPGIGEIDKEDAEFLMKHMDQDGDGKVGLEDFAQIGSYAERAKEAKTKE